VNAEPPSWIAERFLEHRDERRDGFIAEIGRDLLNARAGRQLAQRDDQMQLLAPAPEGQAGFPQDETRETALAERHSISPFGQRAPIGWVVGERRSDPSQARFSRDRQMVLLDRHARQFGEQHPDQGISPRVIALNVVGQLDDQFPEQRRDRKRAAPVRQIGGPRFDVHKEDPGIGGRDIAVLHATRNPHPAMRRDHPQAPGNTTRDAAAEREDELSFAMPMRRHFCLPLGHVNPHGNGRRDDVIRIEFRPGPAERQSHE
jgi:hypothetical protein